MIILEDYTELITNFIVDSVEKFKIQKGKFNSIGIYCCPWAGWLTASFNIDKSLQDTFYNCPDFEFAGFEFFDLNQWQKEYESKAPEYMFEGKKTFFNYDLGDEVLNGLFFKFLSTIVHNLKNNFKEDILLQMLDSNFNKVF